MVYCHFFGRLEIILPLLSGWLPCRYAICHSVATKFTVHSAVHEIWSVYCQEKSLKLLHPDAFARCKIFRKCDCGQGFALDPTGEAYGAPPDPLAGFKEPASKGRGGETGGEGKEGRGRRKRGEKRGKGVYKGHTGTCFSPLRAVAVAHLHDDYTDNEKLWDRQQCELALLS